MLLKSTGRVIDVRSEASILYDEVKILHTTPNMMHLCCNKGFNELKFKYFGGLWVLFEFESVSIAKSYLSMLVSSLGSLI